MHTYYAEMVTLTRVLIDDLTTPYTYADGRLTQVLAVAAQMVSTELNFSNDFKVNIQSLTITPNPTDRSANGTRDDNFINLVCMKAACLIERGETRKSVGQGIAIRDGSSSIDLRGSMDGRIKLLEKGWCAVYEDTKLEYQANRTGAIAGAAIMTPFRVFAGYKDVAYYPYSRDGRQFIQ
jgi:hypothetical protein